MQTNIKNMLLVVMAIDDKFSKPFKLYLEKEAVYYFINSMIEESVALIL